MSLGALLFGSETDECLYEHYYLGVKFVNALRNITMWECSGCMSLGILLLWE